MINAAATQAAAASIIRRAVDVSHALYTARGVRGSVDAGTHATLVEVAAALERTSRDLHTECDTRTEQQLRALDVGLESRGLRLHLGAGARRAEGWIGIDHQDAQLCLDLRRRLPFADGSVRYIYAAHVLEHLRFSSEATGLIREMHRVLEDGGVARLVVPDIEQCLRAYATDDREFFERRKQLWPWARRCATRLQHFLSYAGAGSDVHDIQSHKYGYDYETIRELLVSAGFSCIERSDYMTSERLELRVDNWSKAAGFTCRGRSYSLFVEAVR
jgi:predicted SAM-dependent methyltransferase